MSKSCETHKLHAIVIRAAHTYWGALYIRLMRTTINDVRKGCTVAVALECGIVSAEYDHTYVGLHTDPVECGTAL